MMEQLLYTRCTLFNANKFRLGEQNAMELVKCFENDFASHGVRLTDFQCVMYLLGAFQPFGFFFVEIQNHSPFFASFIFNYIRFIHRNIGLTKILIGCMFVTLSVKSQCHTKILEISR